MSLIIFYLCITTVSVTATVFTLHLKLFTLRRRFDAFQEFKDRWDHFLHDFSLGLGKALFAKAGGYFGKLGIGGVYGDWL